MLSYAAGVGITFVAIRLLPDVGKGSGKVQQLLSGTPLHDVPAPAFAAVLVSLLVFYGFYRLIKASKQRERKSKSNPHSALGPFWAHQTAYAALNAVIGFLILQQVERGWTALLLFFVAKSHALLVLDHAFFDDHGEIYDRIGRWLVAMAIPTGAALHLAIDVPEAGITLMKAVLGGAVILNMLGEEMPREKRASFWPFCLGALFYVTLMMVLS